MCRLVKGQALPKNFSRLMGIDRQSFSGTNALLRFLLTCSNTTLFDNDTFKFKELWQEHKSYM